MKPDKLNLDFATAESANQIAFRVSGIPAPGGSKRAFAIKKGGVYTGRTVVFDDAGQRNKDWRASVALCARQVITGDLLRGALKVHFDFIMPRPKYHFKTSKKTGISLLKADAPTAHTSKPDLTKLIRSTEDALKGILWADDSQIYDQLGGKRYGDKPGCNIIVTEINP